jgi:DNA integrity scanning protein DisA with diadenylate cyclase activity
MLRWQTIIDLGILALTVYFFLRWTAGNRLRGLFLGAGGLFGVSVLASRLELPLAAWVFQSLGLVAILFLVTIFHSELRHLVMRTEGRFCRLRDPAVESSSQQALANAAFSLARGRTGALLVIARKHSTRELAGGGIEMGAAISAPLIEALFQKGSPIHDGGAIIELGRITRAGVLLPLTHRDDVPACFGTRHRAALGICERCDAWAVVVSEERGEVTLVHGSRWWHPTTEAELFELLTVGHRASVSEHKPFLHGVLFGNLQQKLSAVAITGLVWTLSLVSSGTAIRDLTIPVEFTNLPSGLDVTKPSTRQIEVRVRGPRWLVEALHADQLSSRFDLSNVHTGDQVLSRPGEVANLPPGVGVERVRPDVITVSIVSNRKAGSP